MSTSRILSRGRALLQRMPAARAFYRQHGLRATLLRVAAEYLGGNESQSLTAMNHWRLQPETGGRIAPPGRGAVVMPTVALIGALDLPQCKKYRVLQKIEELESRGIRTSISGYFDVPRSFDVMQLATSVLFYRVPDGDLFQGYVAEARRLGLKIIYDIDDPIFCRTIYADNANLQTLSAAERNHLLADSRLYLSAMRQCDAVTVSTPGLVDVASAYMTGRPVHLWRNAVDAESLSICRDIAARPATGAANGQLRIGYMSGSRAHDQDFETIGPALAAILERYPHIELSIVGYARAPAPLQPYEARIKTSPFSSYRGYFQALSEVDIVVIPLVDDTFNACKSAIRFLEAALLEKACVVSAVGDFLNVVEHGRTGYIAAGSDDWQHYLGDLIERADRRQQLGRQAWHSVTRTQSTAAVSDGLAPELLCALKGDCHV